MNQEELKKLFEDQDFVKGLLESGSYENAQKMLKEKGVDLTVDEVKEAAQMIARSADGELSDDELEGVAGGATPTAVATIAGVWAAALVAAGIGELIKRTAC